TLDEMTASCTFALFSTSPDTIHKDALISQMNRCRSGIPLLSFVIRITDAPSDVSSQQFIVEIITEDNASLADTTQHITNSLTKSWHEKLIDIHMHVLHCAQRISKKGKVQFLFKHGWRLSIEQRRCDKHHVQQKRTEHRQ